MDTSAGMRPAVSSAAIAWVSANVIPFEAALRQKIQKYCASQDELSDLVQEVYYRILRMESFDHVREPQGFLVQTAKNILKDRLRRDAIVSIEAVADLEELDVADTAPSPERVALARAELKWVLGIVANLPKRCKQVFRARRIYGLSQTETAASLGISENVVEKEMMKGFKLVSKMVSEVAVGGYATLEDREAGERPARKLNV